MVARRRGLRYVHAPAEHISDRIAHNSGTMGRKKVKVETPQRQTRLTEFNRVNGLTPEPTQEQEAPLVTADAVVSADVLAAARVDGDASGRRRPVGSAVG